MRTTFKALFVAVLFVGGIANSADAQTSSLDGQACKKVGQTQKKAGSSFKCTKVGKKLVWKIASTNANATNADATTNATINTNANTSVHIAGSKYKINPTQAAKQLVQLKGL